jgi:hypothetical protein
MQAFGRAGGQAAAGCNGPPEPLREQHSAGPKLSTASAELVRTRAEVLIKTVFYICFP